MYNVNSNAQLKHYFNSRAQWILFKLKNCLSLVEAIICVLLRYTNIIAYQSSDINNTKNTQ